MDKEVIALFAQLGAGAQTAFIVWSLLSWAKVATVTVAVVWLTRAIIKLVVGLAENDAFLCRIAEHVGIKPTRDIDGGLTTRGRLEIEEAVIKAVGRV